jgi:DNA-directed RNA polymerase subunit RPC12/RpoP
VSSGAKIAAAVALIAVIGVCAWGVVRSMTPEPTPEAKLGWRCAKCGEEFEAPREDDAKPDLSESDTLYKATCPKCGGVAFRLAPFQCAKCKHTFDLFLAPDPETGKGPAFTCPECGDPHIAPVEKR